MNLLSSLLSSLGPGTYGITGPAGSGKTTTSKTIAKEINAVKYSADYRFFGDSNSRKLLLEEKLQRSFDAYRDSVNQFNWWDWSTIKSDLDALSMGKEVIIDKLYNRDEGCFLPSTVLKSANTILYESAILGPDYIVKTLKKVIYLVTSEQVRFERLVQKDLPRRSFNEICARFLVTQYSEAIYYRHLFKMHSEKIIIIDATTLEPCRLPSIDFSQYIPVRVSL